MIIIPNVRRYRALFGLVSLVLLAGACSTSEAGAARTAVASFYPLAFAAERVGGPGWEVIDLTPPGAEAHDVELSIESRAAIEDADVVLYLGDLGFQPQVEGSIGQAGGEVVAVADGLELMEARADDQEEAALDPHIWLDPAAFAEIVDRVAEGFAASHPGSADQYRSRAADLRAELAELDARYGASLQGCRHDTIVVSHEAFGYLAARYGIEQAGLAGIEPEGEATAGRLGEAGDLLAEGRAGAVFYEAGGEAQRVAETVANDAGVPAIPLSTLESEPSDGDYLSVMESNLESLRRGLGCR
jgi:zinc transport system substrate-binding protein